MAEQLPPYNLQYPDGFDDPADFPNLLQATLLQLSQQVIGQFDTQASAQAALGSSSASPIFYTTTSPTTLWCLDSSGATAVWSAGSAYTAATFTIAGSDGTTFSLGNSTKYLFYKADGARVTGWGYVSVGSTGVAWPAGKSFEFPLPFTAQSHAANASLEIGSCMVSVNGNNYCGPVVTSSATGWCTLFVNDGAKTNGWQSLSAVAYNTGNAGSALTWSGGDQIRYSFDYERHI